jgi:hypothetical protein
MAKCNDCGQEMMESVGCTAKEVRIEKKMYKRIPNGDSKCHDCAVPAGKIHHYGCDMERCPVCDGQLAFCSCLVGFRR